jgi:exosome complex component RRP40
MCAGQNAEEFRVDIHGSCLGILPLLAFESATKRNRPNLSPGDLVLARVTDASIDLEPELSCMDAQGKSAGYGPLRGGFVFDTDSVHSRRLRSQPPPPEIQHLQHLSAALKWEMTVGANGRIWVSSEHPQKTAAIARILQECATLDDGDDVQAVIDRHKHIIIL